MNTIFNEPTIFEPRLKFKRRLKFFKFGLWFTSILKILADHYQVCNRWPIFINKKTIDYYQLWNLTKVNTFIYITHYWSDNGFKSTLVNRALSSLQERLLKITLKDSNLTASSSFYSFTLCWSKLERNIKRLFFSRLHSSKDF